MPKDELEDRIRNLEKLTKEHQEDLKRTEKSIVYLISLIITAARETGMTKDTIAKLLDEALSGIGSVISKQQFRRIIRSIRD